MGLQFGPKFIEFPDSACWKDPVDVVAKVTRGASKGATVLHTRRCSPRTASWIAGFVVHTTSGTVTKVRPGLIESVADWTYYRYMRDSARSVSWHATFDLDGSVIQHADPWQRCWHASQVNDATGGCELVQTKAGELTSVQLDAFVRFMDVWTRETGVPRIIPYRDGKPYRGKLSRALSAHGAGKRLCAIYGHRNVWSDKGTPYRGAGDPGDGPFEALAKAGYLTLDLEAGDDQRLWAEWQLRLGVKVDGIPGPLTRRAMVEHGLPCGMLVERPGDREAGTPAWMLR